MKTFRKIWICAVVVLTLAFVGYCSWQFVKADSSGPVITGGNDRIEISIHDGDDVLLEGITAKDKKDGDVTKSLLVEKISPFYENTRIATIVAFDSDNHISKVEREIVYTDYVSPRFELTGSLRLRAGESINLDKIVKASDCLDGDLTNKIKLHSDISINNRVTGLYTIVYEVTNSAGDYVKLPVDMEIYEPFNNEVQLNLDRYLVYYEGEDIPYKDFLVSIRQGSLEYAFAGVSLAEDPELEAEENETEESEEQANAATKKISKNLVQIRDEVNYRKPGVYPVYYHYKAEGERVTYEAIEVLYVVVE